jgi:valyl-tRNA synthetase
MGFVQEVIRAIRDLRSKYTIPPQTKIAARIRAAAADATILQGAQDLLITMAGLESITMAPDLQRSPDAATAVVKGVEISIPSVVDVAKEQARLTRQRDQLRSRLIGSQRKLANDNFLSKASPDVVQKERERLADCEMQIANVEAALTALEA